MRNKIVPPPFWFLTPPAAKSWRRACCCPNMGHFRCVLKMVKRFANVLLHWIISNVKIIRKISRLSLVENFLLTPIPTFFCSTCRHKKMAFLNEIVQLVDLRRSGLGKHFLGRATLKSLWLPGAAYITFVYVSYNIRFKIWINDNIVLSLCCFLFHIDTVVHTDGRQPGEF